MTSYVPKYQFSAIAARRAAKGAKNATEFKYQRLYKNGKWGKVLTGDNSLYTHRTPQEVIEYWNQINPNTKFRLAEE